MLSCADPREQALRQHERLLRSVVSRFSHSGIPVDELLQAGRLGLLQALDRYDPTAGTLFSTFAVPTIRGAILREVRRTLAQREGLSLHQLDERDALRKLPAPTPTQRRRLALLEAAQPPVSLDVRIGEDGDETLAELLPSPDPVPEQEAVAAAEKTLLWEQVTALDAYEAAVLRLRFRDELPLREVARLLGRSQEGVRRIEKRGLRRLRERLEEEGLALAA